MGAGRGDRALLRGPGGAAHSVRPALDRIHRAVSVPRRTHTSRCARSGEFADPACVCVACPNIGHVTYGTVKRGCLLTAYLPYFTVSVSRNVILSQRRGSKATWLWHSETLIVLYDTLNIFAPPTNQASSSKLCGALLRFEKKRIQDTPLVITRDQPLA